MLTDRDILAIEPTLFSDACFTSQTLCGGTNGIVAGTQFTASGVDFNASGVTAGGVIHLKSVDGSIDGGFEIISVLDAGHLSVSILRSDPSGAAMPVGSASGLTWSIKTFGPQIALSETQLSHRLRCLPGWEDATVTLAELDNPDAVRLVWLYCVLAHLYGAMVGTTEAAETRWDSYQQKRNVYRAMAEMMIRLL